MRMNGKAVFIPIMLGLALAFLWGFVPSSEAPNADEDVRNLKLLMRGGALKNCRLDKQRQDMADPNDSDDMESMGFAWMNTQVSMICANGRINANAYTYRTRFGALWNSYGLTQCGVDYCQESRVSGRQAFIVTTIRF